MFILSSCANVPLYEDTRWQKTPILSQAGARAPALLVLPSLLDGEILPVEKTPASLAESICRCPTSRMRRVVINNIFIIVV
jgi:hypothetical protein